MYFRVISMFCYCYVMALLVALLFRANSFPMLPVVVFFGSAVVLGVKIFKK